MKNFFTSLFSNFQKIIAIHFLRPAWVSKILVYIHTVTTHSTNWIQRFKVAPSRERWLMIKKPLLIFIALFLLVKFGPLFTPPKILTSFPGNQSVEAPLDTKIEVIFNKGVLTSSAEKSFTITPNIQGKISWESNQKLIFTPTNKFERGKEYKVTFKGLVLSTFLIPLVDNTTITFETIGNPKVVVASPRQEAIEDLTPVTVVFDRQMIPLTTATNSAEKQPAFTISPKINGDGKWLGTTAYQFRPSEPFNKETTYTVTIPAGMLSQDRGKLQSAYFWQFSSQLPHIDAVTPLSGYNYASPIASSAATFNQNIKSTSIADKITIYDKNR